MKTLTVSLLLSAMLALTRPTPLPSVMWEYPTTTIPEYDYFHGGWHPSCPHGWTMFSIRCLRYVPRAMTWADAEQHCYTEGGKLATVMEDGHDHEIRQVLQSAGRKQGKVWIGGHGTPESLFGSWGNYFGLYSPYHYYDGHFPNQHDCHQKTFGDEARGHNDTNCDTNCDTKLPSVCSLILM